MTVEIFNVLKTGGFIIMSCVFLLNLPINILRVHFTFLYLIKTLIENDHLP